MLTELLTDEGYAVDVAARRPARPAPRADPQPTTWCVLDRRAARRRGPRPAAPAARRGRDDPDAGAVGAAATPRTGSRGSTPGAEDYLGKPFDVDELLARLRALLRRHLDQAPGPARARRASLDLDDPRGAARRRRRAVGAVRARGALLATSPAARGGCSPAPSCSTRVFAEAENAGRGRHLRALPAAQARPRASSRRSAASATGSAGRERCSRRPRRGRVRAGAPGVARLGLQAAAFVAVAVVLSRRPRSPCCSATRNEAVTKLQDATSALADDAATRRWTLAGDPRRTRTGRHRRAPGGADDPAAFAAVGAAPRRRPAGRRGHLPRHDRAAHGRVRGPGRTGPDPTAGRPQPDPRRHVAAGAAGLVLAAAAGTWLEPARAGAAVGSAGAATPVRRRRRARAAHAADPDRHPGAAAAAAPAEGRDGGEPPRAWSDAGPLTAGTLADQALADVDGVVADSAHLAAILEDLLLAADPRTGRAQRVVDLTAVCRDTVRSAGALAHDRGVALHGPDRPTTRPRSSARRWRCTAP